MHYYQHNIADYRKDTAHLSLLEHGIYRQILDTYYLNEKPIETQLVIRRLSIKTEEEMTALNLVLDDFFEASECGKYHIHKRCDAEINAYQAKAETARVNGSKGGRPPKPKKTQPVKLANPEKTGSKPNQEPLTINQEPITNTKTLDQSSIDREFDHVWALYERKGNKKTSKARYSKLSESKRKAILKHIPDYVLSTPDKKFRKDFEKYLNLEAWNDEVIPNATHQQPNQPGRSSAVDRVRRANEERERQRQASAGARPSVGVPDGDLRPHVGQSVRGNDTGELGAVIDGHFTRAD